MVADKKFLPHRKHHVDLSILPMQSHFFLSATILCSLKSSLFIWVFFTHNAKNPDVLISVLYIAAKPKFIEMVLSIIQYICLHNIRRFYELKGINIASVVQKLWPCCWIWLNVGFHVLYKTFQFSLQRLPSYQHIRKINVSKT